MGKQNKAEINLEPEKVLAVVDLRDINEQLLISALREQELASTLENERARLAVILDSIADAVLVIDSTGAPVLTNAAYTRLIGNPGNIMLVEDASGETGPMDRAPWLIANHNEPFTVEFSTLDTEGMRRWWEAHGQPIAQGHSEQGVVIVIRDVSTHKQLANALHHQALHDALTGLPNRVLLYDRLERVLRSSDRTLDPLALFVMDLDHFKEVNDTLGHQAGDLMLREVAVRLLLTVRAADTVARMGGDEFAILLPKTDQMGAMEVASRIRGNLGAVVMIDGQAVQISASIGIVIWSGRGAEAEVLINRADTAMYEAKRTQQGYVIQMNEATGTTMHTEQTNLSITRALQSNETEG